MRYIQKKEKFHNGSFVDKTRKTIFHKAKKSLGQNFLKSKSTLLRIIEVGEISKRDTVLEIGPGKGALTEKILEKSKEVIAVEKDRDLIKLLQEKFAKEISKEKLTLLESDILKWEIPNKKYKLIANIPYNITGAILKKFLTAQNQPTHIVLMVQYEVAKRIMGKYNNSSKESLLSISVKAYGKPKIVTKVPARFFSPVPKVDSAILVISDISRSFFIRNSINEEVFWNLVKTSFAHKRKKLSHNIKRLSDAHTSFTFSISNTPTEKRELKNEYLNKRAEELSLEDWKKLASLF
ncbi:MAG: 16S rRNA (adenine(1518)-N(6)/adenine(1519)-N(6))-dimethyltransferase RsmA [Candidatus Paceibacterota bacterium]|jgi:16S rRNA (adenine1518-N6/adenine1519-N6)-dimethyltransferase